MGVRKTLAAHSTNGLKNDAIVVVCLKDMSDGMTWQDFRSRAQSLGYVFSVSECHNMLSRSIGYTNKSSNGLWVLTARGQVYRDSIVAECNSVVRNENIQLQDKFELYKKCDKCCKIISIDSTSHHCIDESQGTFVELCDAIVDDDT